MVNSANSTTALDYLKEADRLAALSPPMTVDAALNYRLAYQILALNPLSAENGPALRARSGVLKTGEALVLAAATPAMLAEAVENFLILIWLAPEAEAGRRALTGFDRATTQLAEHNTKLAQVNYERALARLTPEHPLAVAMGDLIMLAARNWLRRDSLAERLAALRLMRMLLERTPEDERAPVVRLAHEAAAALGDTLEQAEERHEGEGLDRRAVEKARREIDALDEELGDDLGDS